MLSARAIRSHLLSACLGATVLAAAATFHPASAIENVGLFDDFLVQYDQVELMRLDEDVADIIVGNPSIADVTIQSGRLLIVTGKTFGVTNLIALNNAGQVIINRRLVVRADDQKVVHLNRGALRETYNCAPKCQSILTVGDEQSYYSRIAKAAEDKFKVSATVVEAGQGGD